MLALAERLVQLTSNRDRAVLDAGLVDTLRAVVPLSSVAVYRSCGDVGDERWSRQAAWSLGEGTLPPDRPWTEGSDLPLLADVPLRWRAWNAASPRTAPAARGGGAEGECTVFPLTSARQVPCVVECVSVGPLDAMARQLVAALLNIHANLSGLLDYSERDTLTGLLNRKTFDDSFLRDAMPAAGDLAPADGEQRVATPNLWLALIDIDHFKRVNDDFGHLIGDEVLLMLSQIMTGCFRTSDRLYRFGGEEFVVLLRCAGQVDAVAALERLRARLERHRFPRVGQITISVGLTGIQRGDAPTAAVERADQAVYHAKGHGRNQVCCHAELVALGALQNVDLTGGIELF